MSADAESVIIAMGSVCDTIDETIDFLMARGEKVGVIKVNFVRGTETVKEMHERNTAFDCC